jgi:aspartyl protease family protein
MENKTMGRGMMALACMLGIGVLTLFFSEVEQQQRNPNQRPVTQTAESTRQVALERNRSGHYLVTGDINGQAAEFLLDTGATDVVVPAEIAASLGLQRGRKARAMTANGAITVFETRINELSIGDITLFNVRASINPAMPPPQILLGMSALKQIEFVQRGDSLTLIQHLE